MEFSQLATIRQSCRSYKTTPVEREKLDAMIKTARLSPSACNSQPWKFIVVDNPEKVKGLVGALYDGIVPINKFASQCPAFIIIVEDKANLSAKLGGKYKDQAFSGIDLGIAVAHLSFEAVEQGLSTCIMGWFNEKKIKSEFSIPAALRVRMVLAVGYAEDETIRPKKRKELESIVGYNTWK